MTTTALMRKNRVAEKLDVSPSGLDKLIRRDPTFPRPIKFGQSRQSAAFFPPDEVDEWLERQKSARGAV